MSKSKEFGPGCLSKSIVIIGGIGALVPLAIGFTAAGEAGLSGVLRTVVGTYIIGGILYIVYASIRHRTLNKVAKIAKERKQKKGTS